MYFFEGAASWFFQRLVLLLFLIVYTGLFSQYDQVTRAGKILIMIH